MKTLKIIGVCSGALLWIVTLLAMMTFAWIGLLCVAEGVGL